MGPDEAGDDAAPVDVAGEQDRHARLRREAHVGDIAVAQVDLGGAAGTLTRMMSARCSSRPKLSSTAGMSVSFRWP